MHEYIKRSLHNIFILCKDIVYHRHDCVLFRKIRTLCCQISLNKYSDNFEKLSGIEVAHMVIHVNPPGSNLDKKI